MNLDLEPGKDKQNYVVCISVSRDNGKIIRKEMSKSFFQNYHYHYGMVKLCWNVGFKEIDTEWSTRMDFDFIMDSEYCEEYLKSISNKIIL